MKLPAGTPGGTVTNPQGDRFLQHLMTFCGAVEIKNGAGHGFIIARDGKLVAAYFKNTAGVFRGKNALVHMTGESSGAAADKTLNLRKYDESDFSTAIRISREEKLLITDEEPVTAGRRPAPASVPQVFLDEQKLARIRSQPGVIAVSAFFEGFPVQSMGNADFEHVAASAEDFMRAGTKIAQDMKIGDLEQLILETSDNKFIIAPCRDLYLCILTAADAQLGLIRVVLKSIQSETAG